MKTVAKSVELLKIRTEKVNISETDLPPIYTVFYETFDIGKNKMNVPSLFLEQVGMEVGMLEQRIDSEIDFVVYDFLSIEESLVFQRNAIDDFQESSEFWTIAECDSGKFLVVSKGPQNLDEIHLINPTKFADGSETKKISDNIFQFMGILSYMELYKKWGEHFWRVQQSV